ncbi:hypothetical protein [Paenibacillus sp. IHBB 3054]|uniref:hypothetical protein n=1 Tax=Paenibacillus sp. IHBB 3054 TaxID=3425689 RepID=UPI003F66FE9E
MTKGTYSVDFIIDAIDIFGELLSPDTVIPTPTETPTPTVTPTPEQPTGDRAILVVTMNTGLEKEFDLDKHDNNKGPFSKHTEYVVHDKILTFEVSEYTATK